MRKGGRVIIPDLMVAMFEKSNRQKAKSVKSKDLITA